MKTIPNIMSVDVEDWFHILELTSTPQVNEWRSLESRVEKNLNVLLDLFDEHKIRVTCFFLGWIGEKFPQLVRETDRRGHEVASHGYGHRLIYSQSRLEFSKDIKKGKDILEQIIGRSVIGYRAPGFSITRETEWALEELVQAGFKYDSSLFPASRGHGGYIGGETFPHEIKTRLGTLKEFPISVKALFGKPICFFGGGYLRVFPYSLISKMSALVNQEGRPVIYYIHPREIDPQHPRLKMGLGRRFRSYVNLHGTLKKLRLIASREVLTNFREWNEKFSHLLKSA